MLYKLRIVFQYCTFTFATLFILSCNGTNVDTVNEISCSQADGLWTRVSATCDGTPLENIAPVTYLFDAETDVVLETAGRVDCTTTFNWNVEIGEETAIFSMNGQGNQSCMESGEEVNFCESDVNSCNAGLDFTGIKNEYPTCVINQDGMSLIRTVSPINSPDGLSLCENGEQERVTLIQGEYTPPAPDPDPGSQLAFLDIDGPNPLDFGTHPIGSRITRTLIVTNTGSGIAGSVNGTGLANPYLFLGGSFPGTGGTCGGSLNAGASCTIIIEFFPAVGGYFTDNMILTYSNGAGTITLNQGVAGTASDTLAQLTLSNGPVYSYGQVAIGNTSNFIFTLTNNGGGGAMALSSAGLDAPYQFTGGTYPGTGGTCAVTLAAGANCLLDVEFAPVAEGPFNEIIEINYLDGVNNQVVRRNIFGQGIP